MGFRDSNQDLLGFVHMVPARARQRILDLAATQTLLHGGAVFAVDPSEVPDATLLAAVMRY